MVTCPTTIDRAAEEALCAALTRDLAAVIFTPVEDRTDAPRHGRSSPWPSRKGPIVAGLAAAAVLAGAAALVIVRMDRSDARLATAPADGGRHADPAPSATPSTAQAFLARSGIVRLDVPERIATPKHGAPTHDVGDTPVSGSNTAGANAELPVKRPTAPAVARAGAASEPMAATPEVLAPLPGTLPDIGAEPARSGAATQRSDVPASSVLAQRPDTKEKRTPPVARSEGMQALTDLRRQW